MPNVGKAADSGWMYHVANKTRNTEPVGAPPPSQIPGLNHIVMEPPPEDSCRLMIKESDSDYVRLAKQGGRADLLVFRDPKPLSEKPKGYPRVDWFYLEDNKAENAANAEDKEPYQSAMPDYMVHRSYMGASGSKDEDEYAPKRAPFHFDNKSVFQRDSATANDKTVAIAEPAPSGHGVRNARHKKQSVTKKKAAKEEPSEQKDSRYHTVPRFDNEEEKPVMSKILSYGYVRDWEDKRKQWQDEQAQATAAKEETVRKTEESVKKSTDAKPQNKSQNNRNAGDATDSSDKVGPSDHAREPFKMSKFKNVPARTNTHRNNET